MDFHQIFGICIDIVEIWFRVVNGQISSNFGGVIDTPIFSFLDNNLSKCQGNLTVLVLILRRCGLGLLTGKFSLLSARDRIMAGFHLAFLSLLKVL